ncbi:MAG TPA: SDR family NAD(P)-dependent oxidoreductase [Gemmatimonadales bacterium]|nr:SDR family NAD(P)-dependent oxidoreductase [Gemmatimonadales bacterium]
MPNPTSQVALVTGATAGIGRATAFALGRAGWAVGVCARSGARVDALLAELRAAGIRAAGRAADVGDPAAVEALVGHVERELGPVDALVNNAGVLYARPLAELTLEEWDESMRTNVRAIFLLTRAVLPGMRARKAGAIVNVASLSGKTGFAGGTAYCASKHAVMGFSRALLPEVRGDGIRVIAVLPGSVDTAMIRRQTAFESDPARILQPEDVAATILHALTLPPRALVSEVEVRPTTP